MRVWDVHPGYLNRQSLLGEHRELHAIVVILRDGKKGYSRHPETLRWRGHGWALRQRHALLAAEMALRGYVDRTPVLLRSGRGRWPSTFVDLPGRQFALLSHKYRDRSAGRIPLPASTQQLWAQHKYSVMARSVPTYKEVGACVSRLRKRDGFDQLADRLVGLCRLQPTRGSLRNALQHLWGYVSRHAPDSKRAAASSSLPKLLLLIQHLALREDEEYLLASTALSELGAWI